MSHFFMFVLELVFQAWKTQPVFEVYEAYIHLSLNLMYPVMWLRGGGSYGQAQDTHDNKS